MLKLSAMTNYFNRVFNKLHKVENAGITEVLSQAAQIITSNGQCVYVSTL